MREGCGYLQIWQLHGLRILDGVGDLSVFDTPVNFGLERAVHGRGGHDVEHGRADGGGGGVGASDNLEQRLDLDLSLAQAVADEGALVGVSVGLMMAHVKDSLEATNQHVVFVFGTRVESLLHDRLGHAR